MNNNTNICYSGKVTVTSTIGKHVLSKKTYHNRGALALYRFLANCLSGNFPAAYHLRPFKIRLLSYTGADDITPADFNMEQALMTNGAIEPVTDFITLAAAPDVSYISTNDTCGCQVAFNFIFPYDTMIAKPQGANIVAIYGPGIQNSNIGDFCAYYLLTTQAEILEGSEAESMSDETSLLWDPIYKDSDAEETNKILAVEWTMSLNNKTN